MLRMKTLSRPRLTLFLEVPYSRRRNDYVIAKGTVDGIAYFKVSMIADTTGQDDLFLYIKRIGYEHPLSLFQDMSRKLLQEHNRDVIDRIPALDSGAYYLCAQPKSDWLEAMFKKTAKAKPSEALNGLSLYLLYALELTAHRNIILCRTDTVRIKVEAGVAVPFDKLVKEMVHDESYVDKLAIGLQELKSK